MKTVFFTLLAMFVGFNVANAQLVGGFDGPGAPSMSPISIQQALTMRNDTIVVIRGKIVNNLGDEKYLFKDETGDVIIEIDDEDWHGVRITPQDTIEIVGEIDKEFLERTKIDVKSFTIVK